MKQKLNWAASWRGASIVRDTAPPVPEIMVRNDQNRGEISRLQYVPSSIDDAASTCCHSAASEPFSVKQKLDWAAAWRCASIARDTAPPVPERTVKNDPGEAVRSPWLGLAVGGFVPSIDDAASTCCHQGACHDKACYVACHVPYHVNGGGVTWYV